MKGSSKARPWPDPCHLRTTLRGVVIALACTLLASRTRAEDIDTQRFQPRATTGGYLQTEGTGIRHPIDPFSLGVWLGYAHRPLIAVEDDTVTETLVGQQLSLDLTAAYAFATWFELGVHAPLAVLVGDDVGEAALGDLRLLPKVRLLNDMQDGIGLALLLDLRLPTHTSAFYGGARAPALAPRLLLDHRFGLSGFRLGLDVGVLLRKGTQYRNIRAASELLAGLGLGYRFDGGRAPVELMVDLRGALGLVAPDSEEVALEGLLGLSVDVSRDWSLQGGGGLGILEGFGVPAARAFFGLRWEPSPNDPDHDGVQNPEPMADRGRIPSESDDDTYEDEPASVDHVDDLARAAAIRGGYDACPDLPEDLDGIEDDDGCPEGDADGDGVLDYQDRCPDEAETINGFEDDDGCEDEGPAKIIIEHGQIRILETIRFELNSARIDPSSHDIMNQIALMFRKHQEIDRIEIAGHTDNTGPHGFNMVLSRERARAVRQYLLQRGLPPARLSARGYGPDQPIADNESRDGRTENRRVEFRAVQQRPAPGP